MGMRFTCTCRNQGSNKMALYRVVMHGQLIIVFKRIANDY